jgi:hypothetical protein
MIPALRFLSDQFANRGFETPDEDDQFHESLDTLISEYNRRIYAESSFLFKFTASLALILFEAANLKQIWKKWTILFAILLYAAYISGIIVHSLDKSYDKYNTLVISSTFISCCVAAINGLLLIIGPRIQSL